MREGLYNGETCRIMNEDTKNMEHLTVMLEKGLNDRGFGIAISGGLEGANLRGGDTSLVVSDVIPGSPADSLVNVGDTLIAINGTNVENVEHELAVDLLRSLKKNLLRRPKPCLFQKQNRPSINVPCYGNTRQEKEPANNGEKYQTLRGPTEDYKDLSFVLKKGKQEFGLYLGNVIFVKDKISGSPASMSDIQMGDLVIAINGTPLETCRSTDEVLSLIKSSGKTLDLRVLRPNANWLPTLLTEKSPYITYKPQKQKGKRSSSVRSHVSLRENPIEDNPIDNRSFASRSDRLQEELTRVVRSHSVGETESQGKNYSKSKCFQENLDQSVSKFDTTSHNQQYPQYKYRERESSKMDESYDAEQILPIINDVHRKHYNKPRSVSTSNVLYNEMIESRREARSVKILNSGEHLGIQLVGGNKNGIFVSAVLDNSPAYYGGLKVGDQIITVNDVDFRHVTREEAVIVLLSLKNVPVLMSCINRPTGYEKIRFQLGDEFFIRVNFDYLKPFNPNEIVLHKGELLIVRDTMFGGTIGSWSAVKLNAAYESGESGVIPNKARAEQLSVKSRLEEQKNKEMKNRLRGGRNRNINTRSEYQSQDKLDKSSFTEEILHIPAYISVTKRRADFMRPVILLGVASDIYREYLHTALPDQFDIPMSKSSSSSKFERNNNRSVIKMNHIRRIVAEDKHCLLDVSPEAIELMHYVNLSPIVILIRMADKKLAKSAAVGMVYGKDLDPISKKEARRINRFGTKFYKKYPNLLNGILEVFDQPVDHCFIELLNIIRAKQMEEIFVSEDQPDQNILESFTFKEPNYASDIGSQSESGTEDDEFSTQSQKNDDGDKVFLKNKYEAIEQKVYDDNDLNTNEKNKSGRKIDIKYEVSEKDESDKITNTTSFDSTKQQKSNVSINESKSKKSVEFVLNAVLRIPADGQGGLKESPSTNVSVYVPPGVLTSDFKFKEIYVKIYLQKPTKKISYEKSTPLIVCGPEGLRFSRPIEIRMPIGDTNIDKIDTKIRTSPDFYSNSSQWKKMLINTPDSACKTIQLADNMIAFLVDRF